MERPIKPHSAPSILSKGIRGFYNPRAIVLTNCAIVTDCIIPCNCFLPVTLNRITVTAERSCPCKQLACPAIGGGSEVTFKPLVPRLLKRAP
ncbi:hypothetical protein J6590_076826 [Homalodisca vitripennis]|nr:hypothetical protein J6590_076826 [Homalodisca vitripennis]